LSSLPSPAYALTGALPALALPTLTLTVMARVYGRGRLLL
jgi:hypothetical protein